MTRKQSDSSIQNLAEEKSSNKPDLIINSAYYHNNRIDFKDRQHPLFVGSCGMYRLITRPKLPTYRPRGRLDFQLLYVAAGRAWFYFHGKRQVVNAGNMVLYRPKEEQRYYYYAADSPEVYWVHFTGNDVTNILRRYGFLDQEHVIYTGTSIDYKNLFRKMIEEMRACRQNYEELLTFCLQELFIMIRRARSLQYSGEAGITSDFTTGKRQNRRNENPFLTEEMEIARRYFQTDYQKPIQIEEYAASRGMSISWFIRSFRKYTGYPPNQYLIAVRITHAENLLQTTSASISEIASAVGYDNPLYFSRLFHKLCGQSPREFRRQFLEEEEDRQGDGPFV